MVCRMISLLRFQQRPCWTFRQTMWGFHQLQTPLLQAPALRSLSSPSTRPAPHWEVFLRYLPPQAGQCLARQRSVQARPLGYPTSPAIARMPPTCAFLLATTFDVTVVPCTPLSSPGTHFLADELPTPTDRPPPAHTVDLTTPSWSPHCPDASDTMHAFQLPNTSENDAMQAPSSPLPSMHSPPSLPAMHLLYLSSANDVVVSSAADRFAAGTSFDMMLEPLDTSHTSLGSISHPPPCADQSDEHTHPPLSQSAPVDASFGLAAHFMPHYASMDVSCASQTIGLLLSTHLRR